MGLRSFLSKKTKRAPETRSPEPSSPNWPAPDQPHFIVGDVHGRLDLLEKMLAEIDALIGRDEIINPLLCFVGNALDRGPDSCDVLRRLKELTDEFPDNVVCLLGNHEQMLLDVLQAPAARHARWLREGGDATCLSYDLPLQASDIQPHDADRLADALSRAIGVEMLDWLKNRPVRHHSGNLTVVHAGADPARPMAEQTDRVMIWGHPEFMTRPRVDGHWVAHGHYVVERPMVLDGRVSVNTEAWTTGVLSSVFLPVEGEPLILQVRDRVVLSG